MDKNLGLGRGLSALMGEEPVTEKIAAVVQAAEDGTAKITMVLVDTLVPSVFQPRRIFDEEALKDLTASILEKGVLQPLLVRKHPKKEGMYEIIAGERRFRASKQAGLEQVPVIIHDFSDRDASEISVIENLQREDLNPLEEGEAYARLIKEFNYTQEQLSQIIGKSRSHIANQMRLVALPPLVKQYLENKELTAGHARAILTASFPEELAREVVEKGLSVRQTERLCSTWIDETSRAPKAKQPKDPDLVTLERDLSDVLKAKVSIKCSGNGDGKVVISYDSLEKLDSILQRLMAR